MSMTESSDTALVRIGEKIVLFHQPPGTFALTPASHTLISAIEAHGEMLRGIGLDWGCGIGCAAISAVIAAEASMIYGLEIDPRNIAAAKENAIRNGVEDRARFLLSDSYRPFDKQDRDMLSALKGKIRFVLSNPPASTGDDGFSFRREVLRGAANMLMPGGVVFLNISFQYGRQRIRHLSEEIGGFAHKGVLYSTSPVAFDLSRPDLLQCIELYAAQEDRGVYPYEFLDPEHSSGEPLDARAAYAYYKKTGNSPLTMWQTHLFEYQI